MERQEQSNEQQVKFQRLETIRQVVEASGLQSDERHKFRLTPDRLELDMDCLRQFQAIGDFCIVYFKALEKIYQMAVKGEFPPSMNAYVRDAIERTVTKGQRMLQKKQELGMPLMFRTDCVIAKGTDCKRRVFVTEIEGERPIGLGFERLANQMSQAISEVGNGEAIRPIGGVEGLKIILEENRDILGNQPLAVVLGEDQLFYLEEQTFFTKEAQQAGISIELVREKDLDVDQAEGVLLPGFGVRTRFLMNLPVFNTQKSGKPLDTSHLFYAALNGDLQFIQPPKKFFGTKAGMALLFVPFLRKFFIENGIVPRTIEGNVPRSTLITGSCFETDRLFLENGEKPDQPVMVKAVGMSAARGMALPTDREGTMELLYQARKRPFEFMTQEFLDTEEVEFDIFDETSGKLLREGQFMRLTAYYIRSRGGAILTEVEGTGLASQLVHGNPRCIFFPVAFK